MLQIKFGEGDTRLNKEVGMEMFLTRNQWDEIRPTTLSYAIIAMVVIALLWWGISAYSRSCEIDEKEYQDNLRKYGFSDGDVSAFCKIMDIESDELFASEGLRLQFKTFLKGDSSFFIQSAMISKARRASERAERSANTATNLAAVAMVNSNNN